MNTSKYKIFCTTEKKWRYAYGSPSTPITTCPVNTGHTVIANSVSELKTTVTSFILNDASSASTSFVKVGSIRFLGSNIIGAIEKIFVIVNIQSSGTADIRFFDTTNITTIATKTVSNAIDTIIDMGTISNISTNSAIWEIQLKNSSIAGTSNISYIEMIS